MLKQLAILCLTSTLCLGKPLPDLNEDWVVNEDDLAIALAVNPVDTQLIADVLARWEQYTVPIWLGDQIQWVLPADIDIIAPAEKQYESYILMVDGTVYRSTQSTFFYHCVFPSYGWCGTMGISENLLPKYTEDPLSCLEGDYLVENTGSD